MNKGYIRLSEVLDQMDQIGDDNKPIPFHILFVKADRIRGTGGEIIEISAARKVVNKDRQGNPVFDLRPKSCLLYTSPSPRDRTRSRMPSSA